jgi:hypothetical protein
MRSLEPTYRESLLKSWHLVWHHKLLWVLGAVAVLLDQFGLANFFGYIWMYIQNGTLSNMLWWMPASWGNFAAWGEMQLFGFSWLILIMIALLAVLVVVAVSSEGALIAMACMWFKNRLTTVTFERAWHKGVKHFWSLFVLQIAQKILLMGIFLIFTIFLKNNTYPWDWLIFILGTLLALLVSVVRIYAAGYVVEKEYSLGVAVQEGWYLFEQHFIVSIELSVIFLLLNAVALVAISVALKVGLASGVLVWLVAGLLKSKTLYVVGMVVAAAVFSFLVVLLGGIFNAFTISAWMYNFLRMNRKPLASRIKHVFMRIIKRS